MFGWLSRAAERASRRNRWTKPWSVENCSESIFSATMRSSVTWRARYTFPIPPRPSSSMISYVPKVRCVESTSVIGSPCRAIRSDVLEHLERLDQADTHPVEGAGENRNLVLALRLDFGDVHVSHADLIRHVRKPLHGADHDEIEKDVHEDEREREHAHERPEQRLEGLVGHGDRDRHRHGDDLRADDLVQLPAEAVRRTVRREDGRRRDGWRVVADEALRVR